MKLPILAGLTIASSFAFCQVEANSYSGHVERNGSTYGGETIGFGDMLSLIAGPQSSTSSVNLGPGATPPDSTAYRPMMKFSAQGDGDFLLPSDRLGNMSSANSGDSRIFNTWDPAVFGQGTTHQFGASVTQLDSDLEGRIDVDIQDAPKVDQFIGGNGWAHEFLDNSAYDQDSTVGHVTLDTSLTPTITLQYTLMDASFHRGMVNWQDGSSSASMNRDDVYTGSWLLFSDVNSPNYYIGSADGQNLNTFGVGEGDAIKSISSEMVTMTMDVSSIPLGEYEAKHWGIGWWTGGYDNNSGFGSSGLVLNEDVERVTVVPEPASILGFSALCAMLARRKRSSR